MVMKQVFAFETIDEYVKYQEIIQRLSEKLRNYQIILERKYALTDPPKGIVWTTEELTTTTFSNIPIPAYTNKDLIYITPDLNAWQRIFDEQLDGKRLLNVQDYYENNMENELFIILAHELTHHSDLFLDDFDDEGDSGIWFEEGMCFYLPRKLLLDEKEFAEITAVETELYQSIKNKYGGNSLEDFGSASYQGSLASIMFDYWRSYLAIKYLVEVHANHDVARVFAEYHKWGQEGRRIPLLQYFSLESLFD